MKNTLSIMRTTSAQRTWAVMAWFLGLAGTCFTTPVSAQVVTVSVSNRQQYSFDHLEVAKSTAGYGHHGPPGSADLRFDGKVVGDYITFSFDVTYTDRYKIWLYVNPNPNMGTYDVEVDDAKVSSPIDFSKWTVYLYKQGEVGLDQGKHTMTFRVIGKNDKSKGYGAGLGYLNITGAGSHPGTSLP